MTATAWLRFAVRRLISTPVMTTALAALTLVTASVFALAPRLEQQAADRTLRTSVAVAAPDVANIQLHQDGLIGAGTHDPLDGVASTGATLAGEMPEPVAALESNRYVVVDSVRYVKLGERSASQTLGLRIQPGVEGNIRYVEGRAPTGEVEVPDQSGEGGPTVFEVSMPAESARVFGAKVGDVIRLAVDPSDRLTSISTVAPQAELGFAAVSVHLVGTFEPLDPAAPYWFGDARLQRSIPRRVSPTTSVDDTTALLAPSAYADLVRVTGNVPLGYTWRFSVDPDRLSARGLDDVISGLGRLESIFPDSGTARAGGATAIRQTGLLGLARAFRASWGSVEAFLAVLAIGAAAIATLALSLVTALYLARRRPAVVLWQSRGASGVQLVVEALTETVVVGLVPALLALTAVAYLAPVADVRLSWLLGGSVGLWIGGLLVVLTLAGRRRRLGPSRRRTRLLAELLLLALAAVGAWLLLTRGIAISPSSVGQVPAGGRGLDILLAAAPALITLGVGILAVRFAPIVLTLVLPLVVGRRGLVASLALRRAIRTGGSSTALLMLLAIAAFGILSSSALLTLRASSAVAAWQGVGAGYRMTSFGGVIADSTEIGPIPGVESAARAARLHGTAANTGVPIVVLALDAAAYLDVVHGNPADITLPQDLLAAPSASEFGTADRPLPAIASTALASGATRLQVGSVASAVIQGLTLRYRVVAIQDSFPTLDPQPFLVVARPQLNEAMGGAVAATEIFMRPDANAPVAANAAEARAQADAVLAAVRAEVPDATIASAAVEERSLASSPYLTAVANSATLAVVIAALYAALAVIVALAMAGSARAIETAQLVTLGLTRRQVVQLSLVEHGPAVAVAFILGALTGFGAFALAAPGLDIAALASGPGTGSSVTPTSVAAALNTPPRFEPVQLGLLLAELAVIVGVGTIVQAFIETRPVAAAAIRRGIE